MDKLAVIYLLCLILSCQGLIVHNLDQEYSDDTEICMEEAKLKNPEDPNARLDYFANCLLKYLNKISNTDENKDVDEVMSALEHLDKFNESPDESHNIVKRNSEIEIVDEENVGVFDEARGWKNKYKKNKKNKKRNKKKQKYQEVEYEVDDDNEEEDGDEDDESFEDSSKSTSTTTTTSPTDPIIEESQPNKGIQFSAYSQQSSSKPPQPVYKPRPKFENKHQDYDENRKKYLYSVDYHGNAHYIDEDEVSALLKSPQAMKAMMQYLHTQDKGQTPVDEEITKIIKQELRYRVPPQTKKNNFYNYHRRPSASAYPLQPKQQRPDLRTPSPRMEFFGPKDIVPDSPYLLHGGKLSQFSYGNFLGNKIKYQGAPETVYERLEPKPRSLFKRNAEEGKKVIPSSFSERFGIFNIFKKKKEVEKVPKKSRKNRNKKLNKSRTNASKSKATQDNKLASILQKSVKQLERCKKCNVIKFRQKQTSFCQNVCLPLCKRCNGSSDFSKIQSKCKICQNVDLDKIKIDAPQKTTSTTTATTPSSTTTLSTTTLAPRRSLLQQKKECRAKKSESPACIRILDKCNNRVFRATHSGCAKQKGDDEWLVKKCKTEVFYKKFKSSCQGLCVNVLFSLKNPKICKEAAPSENEEDNIESLADIVEKCKKPFYKTKFKEKCEVVETIDTILDTDEEKDKIDGTEGKEKEVENENNSIDASKVKGDIVKSIERQTQERKDNPKKTSNKKKEKDSKTKVSKNKGSKKNKEGPKKKNNDKKKGEMKGKGHSRNKGKNKEKKDNKNKKEKNKTSKHKCNKLKYRITHPDECKDMERMEDILSSKCRKEKYRNKHKERCQSIDSSNNAELTNIVMTQVADIRCQKESFRESYPTICKDSNTKDSLDNKTEWLTERCKHDKFRNRNTKLCSSLEIGETLPSDVSIDDTVTKEETFNTSAEVADKEGDVDDETTISSTDSPSTESSTSFEELTTVNNMSLVA